MTSLCRCIRYISFFLTTVLATAFGIKRWPRDPQRVSLCLRPILNGAIGACFQSTSQTHSRARDPSLHLRVHGLRLGTGRKIFLRAYSFGGSAAHAIRAGGEISTEDPWEFSVRERASEALVPVFYPVGGKYVQAEKALKRSLRRFEKEEHTINATREERDATRKRVAALVLGTSVLRLRHWFIMTQQLGGGMGTTEEIRGVDHTRPPGEGAKIMSDSDRLKVRLRTVRLLVDLQADFMQSQNASIPSPAISWPADPVHRLSVKRSLPFFIAELFVRQYGEEQADELAKIANEAGPITFRRNAILCDSDNTLCTRLDTEDNVVLSPLKSVMDRKSSQDIAGVDSDKASENSSEFGVGAALFVPTGCLRLTEGGPLAEFPRKRKSIWSLQTWKDGWFEVQDVGSQLIVEATGASAGDTIVDYCAGNGGKTLALASRMWRMHEGDPSHQHVKSLIVAHDVVDERLRQLRGSLSRAGLADVYNKTKTGPTITVDTTSDITGYFGEENLADAVLVDAPCSSLGVLRRRPGQRWELTETDVKTSLPETQLEILRNASRLVKPCGGRLVYATCSIVQEENEQVAMAFERSKHFNSQWERWPFAGGDVETNVHFQNILPHIHDSDGFFIARWKRR